VPDNTDLLIKRPKPKKIAKMKKNRKPHTQNYLRRRNMAGSVLDQMKMAHSEAEAGKGKGLKPRAKPAETSKKRIGGRKKRPRQ